MYICVNWEILPIIYMYSLSLSLSLRIYSEWQYIEIRNSFFNSIFHYDGFM